jgi:hypothetical protein
LVDHFGLQCYNRPAPLLVIVIFLSTPEAAAVLSFNSLLPQAV